MDQMSNTQKWMIEEELEELMEALPDYINVEVNELKQTLTFNIIVQNGPYKDHELEFLVKIPDNYKDSPPIMCCMHKIQHPLVNYSTGVVNVPGWYKNHRNKMIKEWSVKYNCLKDIVNVLCFLFKSNQDSPPQEPVVDTPPKRTLLPFRTNLYRGPFYDYNPYLLL